MDKVAGTDKPYIKEAELQSVHDALYIASMTQFDEIATMGTDSLIINLRDLFAFAAYKSLFR
jgi:hypothetical protein